jgi:chromosomal replication initiation ATPase DnaA
MLPRWYKPPRWQATMRGDAIIRVANMFGVTPDAIKGPSRHAPVVAARVYFMREMHDAGLSSGTIGRLLNRDGSTIRFHLTQGRAA